MNTHDPADMAPLSYGCGLALGLMLILGLPAEKPTLRVTPLPTPRDKVPLPTSSRLATDSPRVEASAQSVLG